MFGMKIYRFVCLTISALVTAAALASTASAQEVDARELLERMSAEISGLDGFIVHGDAYSDARLDAGQIIEHSSQVTLRLQRKPGAIRVTKRSTEDTKEVFFDDGLLTVFNSKDKLYAQTEIPKGVDSMLDFAVNEIGIEAPLLDFVAANVADHLLQDASDVRYLETSLIRDQVYHHVGIRLPDVDVQIWIASAGRPLPGKLVITSKWDAGAPRFVAFLQWDTDPAFQRDLFNFEPPDGAVAVDFLVDLQ